MGLPSDPHRCALAPRIFQRGRNEAELVASQGVGDPSDGLVTSAFDRAARVLVFSVAWSLLLIPSSKPLFQFGEASQLVYNDVTFPITFNKYQIIECQNCIFVGALFELYLMILDVFDKRNHGILVLLRGLRLLYLFLELQQKLVSFVYVEGHKFLGIHLQTVRLEIEVYFLL